MKSDNTSAEVGDNNKPVKFELAEASKNKVLQSKLPPIGFAPHWPKLRPEFFDPLPEDELRLWNCEDD